MRAVLCGFLLSAVAEAQDPAPELPVDTPEARLAAVLFLEDARVTDPAPWQRLLAIKDDPAFRARVVRGIGRVIEPSRKLTMDPGYPPLRVTLLEVLRESEEAWTRDTRRAAAFAVGNLQDPGMLRPICRRVSPADLMRALGQVGRLPDVQESRDEVLQAIAQPAIQEDADNSTITDSESARLLYGVRLDEPVFQELARGILAKGGPVGLVHDALYYLQRHRARPPKEFAELIAPFILDGEPAVALWAARALAKCEGAGEDEAKLVTAACLAGGPREVQVERLRALASLPPLPSRAALLAAFKDEDPHLRRTAMESAAAVGEKLPSEDRRGFALFALAMAEDDPVADVRRAAVLALAALDPPAFRKQLPALRLADPWPARAAAAEALRKFSPVEPDIKRALWAFKDDPDRRVRIAAWETLLHRVQHPELAPDPSVEAGLLGAFLSTPKGAGWREQEDSRVFNYDEPRQDDPVLLGITAQIVKALLENKEFKKRHPLRINPAGLLSSLVSRLPAWELEPLQAVIDLAGAVPGEAGTKALQHYAASQEIALRRQAAALLEKRGIEPPSPPALSATEREILLETCRERARRILAGVETAAVIKTVKGDIKLRLFDDDACMTVENFRQLAAGKYYDGVLFHRVVPDFVAQAGCPRGDGWGGPGWTIRCEVTDRTYRRGTLGMALAGKDTGGSQWFITHTATPHLDLRYTIFGEVADGMDVVDSLVPGDAILSVSVTP